MKPQSSPYTLGWRISSLASGTIVLAFLALAALGRLPLLASGGQVLPFVFALIGVTLYVLGSYRTRRDRFDARYVPDYLFRAAQAVVYLYVILAIFAQARGQTGEGSNLLDWPPVLLGLLTGLFILHVEKAMEGLGQRFEEALAAVLSRSLTAKTLRERQLEQLHAQQKFAEIKTQAEALIAVNTQPRIAQAVQALLAEVNQSIRDGDADAIADKVQDLGWRWELLKRAQREEGALAQALAPRPSASETQASTTAASE